MQNDESKKAITRRSKLDTLIGISTNSYNTLIINKSKSWYGYVINNKIIIESIKEQRSQVILQDTLDHLSVSRPTSITNSL